MIKKPFYSPKEYAKLTGIPLTQVYLWLQTGDLDAIQKVKPNGKYYIPYLEIPKFLRDEYWGEND